MHGLDEALRRGRAYIEAGADAIFVEAPETEEELAIVGAGFDEYKQTVGFDRWVAVEEKYARSGKP